MWPSRVSRDRGSRLWYVGIRCPGMFLSFCQPGPAKQILEQSNTGVVTSAPPSPRRPRSCCQLCISTAREETLSASPSSSSGLQARQHSGLFHHWLLTTSAAYVPQAAQSKLTQLFSIPRYLGTCTEGGWGVDDTRSVELLPDVIPGYG